MQDSLFLVILLSGARILAARLPEPAGMAQLQLSLLRSSHIYPTIVLIEGRSRQALRGK